MTRVGSSSYVCEYEKKISKVWWKKRLIREKKDAKLVNTRANGANNDVIVRIWSWRPEDITDREHRGDRLLRLVLVVML